MSKSLIEILLDVTATPKRIGADLAGADGSDAVDLGICLVLVKREGAEAQRDDLMRALRQLEFYDHLQTWMVDMVSVSNEIMSQELAQRLFALGQYLGMWTVITPVDLHLNSSSTVVMWAGSIFISDLHIGDERCDKQLMIELLFEKE